MSNTYNLSHIEVHEIFSFGYASLEKFRARH